MLTHEIPLHLGRRRPSSSSDLLVSDGQSGHSPVGSAAGQDSGGVEDQPESQRDSFVCVCLCEGDLESEVLEMKVHSGKVERDCRICYLGLEDGCVEFGVAIELGYSCKGDLGTAHLQCAEAWFKIKGNTTCEICGTTACSVTGVHLNEANSNTATGTLVIAGPAVVVEAPTILQGRHVMNILLFCVVLTFVISWFFHSKVFSLAQSF